MSTDEIAKLDPAPTIISECLSKTFQHDKVQAAIQPAGKGHRVADPDQRLGFLAGSGSDIDVLAFQLHHRLPVLGVHEMDRLLADHPRHHPLRRMDVDSLSRRKVGIHPADGAEIEKAVVIQVLDLKTDFVRVPHKHHPRKVLSFSTNAAEDVTHDILGHVSKGGNVGAEHPLGRLLVT